MTKVILGFLAMLCLFVSEVKSQDAEKKAVGTILKNGDMCPEFAMKDTTGTPVSMESLRGKYIYIDVWASWCYPCRKEVPFLQKLEKELEGRNIVFVGLSIDIRDFRWMGMLHGASMHGIQWMVQNKDFENAFGIENIPRFILLDPTGKILETEMTRPSDPKTKKFLLELKGI